MGSVAPSGVEALPRWRKERPRSFGDSKEAEAPGGQGEGQDSRRAVGVLPNIYETNSLFKKLFSENWKHFPIMNLAPP